MVMGRRECTASVCVCVCKRERGREGETGAGQGQTIVRDELKRLGQCCQDLLVDSTRLKARGEGPVDGHDAVKGARLGLLEELLSLDGLGLDDVGDVLDLLPGVVGASGGEKRWRQWALACCLLAAFSVGPSNERDLPGFLLVGNWDGR